MPKPSWRCKVCWCINKYSFACCPSCGGEWKHVMDKEYEKHQAQHGAGQPYFDQDWQDAPWQNDQNRHPSPRRHRPKSPRKDYYSGGAQTPRGGKHPEKGGKGTKGKKETKGKTSTGPGKGPSKQEPKLDWKASMKGKMKGQQKDAAASASQPPPAANSAEA